MDTIEVWYAGQLVQCVERLRGQDKHRINYRHVIDWLVRKPGAFARYVYREDLFPSVSYRRAYDALVTQQPGHADKEYVNLLHLASREGEGKVAAAMEELLCAKQPLSVLAVETRLGMQPPQAQAALVEVAAVDLRQYDALLEELSSAVNGFEQDTVAGCQSLEGLDSGGAEGGVERTTESDMRMSQENWNKEVNDVNGTFTSVSARAAGVVPADDAGAARRGGPAGDSGVVELP